MDAIGLAVAALLAYGSAALVGVVMLWQAVRRRTERRAKA